MRRIKLAQYMYCATKIKEAVVEYPNRKSHENSLRELRKKITFAIFAETDNLNLVTGLEKRKRTGRA